ncbi:MAG: LysR family transcriptional regulator [Alcaligenaceae bacterium]|nr:LysR family transcriptional regulator [Alcaligenaceae bacterium]
MKLNPESLLVFAAVARGASVTDAARAWGLSQSAMSSRLQSLENRLDVTLLEREGRRLKLTAVLPVRCWRATPAARRTGGPWPRPIRCSRHPFQQ